MRILLPALVLVTASTPSRAVDFAKDVYPVLQRTCFECHGHEVQKGKLRLDTNAALQHNAIVAGKPEQSDLIRRVSLPKGDKEAMPKRGEHLKPAEIENLKSWIAEGAKWPQNVSTLKHWAYIRPVRPTLPKVNNEAWCKTDMDRFILAKIETAGLQPSPGATPATLIRRLSLDLTGLPPSMKDVEAFEKACANGVDAKAYEALVDKLLASKDFGVRWARPWLDLARYADSHGYQRDDLRDIWGYRDWVVNALNADMPFDQFTIEQVAGDLLPNATPSQIIATGFHRCTPTNVEAGTDPEESRINQVIDRVNTTGAVWMGTTLECAQCHNHKYDPFTQRDYYSLLAYFNNTEKEADRTNPKVPGSIQFKGTAFVMMDASKQAERSQLEAKLTALNQQIAEREKALAKSPLTKVATPSGTTVLLPSAFSAESGSDHDLQADGSVLLTGEATDKDTYTFDADLPATEIKAVMIEALTNDALPGTGPGRGAAERPNFVLDQFDATLTTDGKATPLKFSEAHASFVQGGFDPNSLIGKGTGKGWAIMPQFHKSHWAAFVLEQPVKPAPGSKLTLRLQQNYGGKRTIGCLRVSTISGDVLASLPAKIEDEPVAKVAAKPKGKRAKAVAAPAPALSSDPMLAKLQRQRSALQKELNATKPASTEVMRELAAPRISTVFKRGVFTDPGDPVKPGTPAIIDAKANGSANRLALAKWLVSKDNPLAARVTVNRWWMELFGQGIVTTIEDFGIKGEPPTHPELLDWLAVEFMEHGWSMKHILKQIVMSATYRQQSGAPEAKSEELRAKSGESASKSDAPLYALRSSLYASGPRFRMDAEMIRDNALAIAGLLNLKQGGEPIRPPQPDGLWQKVGGQQYKYEVSSGDEQYRRGLYVVLKRGSPYPSFVNFDACARMATVLKRSRSNTPLQALTLLNDPVYVEATKAFASRIVKDAPSNDLDARIVLAFRLAVARAPSVKETSVLKSLWEAQFEDTKNESTAWYAVASALLNLDECITKN
ncbi:MAG: PSD1 domain-containing protein [Verrucomicrobiaceae bacterium]|nr:PSD1 domain-containing protein [Verrucomicrobiaceae bacterium]